MSYKRCPNNYKTSWTCSKCKLDTVCTKNNEATKKITNLTDLNSPEVDSEIIYLGSSSQTEEVDKYSIIATLTDDDFNVIESATGWLENTVIQQAQVLLKRVNPKIEGFQRTSLGPYCNFDKVCGDFVQILHTGGNHWVCVSSIGCDKGLVNLYDTLFYDVILDDLEQQVQNLVGGDFKELSVVPVQQQSNGSDCGVFAIAFATWLVYTFDCIHLIVLYTNIPQFHVPRMRPHLSACLKAGLITPFPTVDTT